MKLDIPESVLTMLETASERFDFTYAEIIRKALLSYRRGHVAIGKQKRFPDCCCDRVAIRSLSIPELSVPDGITATLLNDILFSYLTYHLSKPARKEAPLKISEADAKTLYLDSGNPSGIYDLAAFLLLKP